MATIVNLFTFAGGLGWGYYIQLGYDFDINLLKAGDTVYQEYLEHSKMSNGLKQS